MINHVLNYLRKQSDAPVLLDDYCELNYGMTWGELQQSENADWIEEVRSLVEDGELRVPTSGTGREQ